MPNFTVQVDGPQLVDWSDAPDVPDDYARLNPLPGRPHRYYSALVDTEVVLRAVVSGFGAAPSDSTLGDETFTSRIAEHPAAYPFAPTSPAGRSSECRFTPPVEGHYLVIMSRHDGGAVGVHVDARRLLVPISPAS